MAGEGTGRLAAIEADMTEVKGDLKAILSAIHGNGKLGINTRLYRLEWALLLIVVMVATSSPVAAALLEVLKR